MEERIKMIWDFRGPNGKKTAEHHAKHLSEYLKTENLESAFVGEETISAMHHTAYMVVEKSDVSTLRDRLKPHRGQVYVKN